MNSRKGEIILTVIIALFSNYASSRSIVESTKETIMIVPLFLRKLVLGIPAQASGKNYAAANAFGVPSRPATRVL